MQSNLEIIEKNKDVPTVERTQIPNTQKVSNNEESRIWENNIRELKMQQKEKTNTGNDGNMTCEPPRIAEPLYHPPDLSREALVTNLLMREAVNNLEELSKRGGKELTKSTELAKEWKKHIEALDVYIKSLSKLPWQKIIGYTACFFTIMGFLYKMGTLRMIPDFVSAVIEILPTPSFENIPETIPKPKADSALNIIMESPITPLALVTGIGVLAISLTTLKAMVWALRKIPK